MTAMELRALYTPGQGCTAKPQPWPSRLMWTDLPECVCTLSICSSHCSQKREQQVSVTTEWHLQPPPFGPKVGRGWRDQ